MFLEVFEEESKVQIFLDCSYEEVYPCAVTMAHSRSLVEVTTIGGLIYQFKFDTLSDAIAVYTEIKNAIYDKENKVILIKCVEMVFARGEDFDEE